jgi:hypothetical protein
MTAIIFEQICSNPFGQIFWSLIGLSGLSIVINLIPLFVLAPLETDQSKNQVLQRKVALMVNHHHISISFKHQILANK